MEFEGVTHIHTNTHTYHTHATCTHTDMYHTHKCDASTSVPDMKKKDMLTTYTNNNNPKGLAQVRLRPSTSGQH